MSSMAIQAAPANKVCQRMETAGAASFGVWVALLWLFPLSGHGQATAQSLRGPGATDSALSWRARRQAVDSASSTFRQVRLHLSDPLRQHGDVTALLSDATLTVVVARFCGNDSCGVERLYFENGTLFAGISEGEWRDSAGVRTPRPETRDEYFFDRDELVGWIPPDGIPREGPYHEAVLDNAAGLVGSARDYYALVRTQVHRQR